MACMHGVVQIVVMVVVIIIIIYDSSMLLLPFCRGEFSPCSTYY